MSYGLVSHEGPTQEQMEAAVCEVIFEASGYSQGAPATADARPDKKVRLKITMGDPG
jgi:hypothetical protein